MAEKFDIDKLIDKPLNELTEDEAEYVIEWRAMRKTEEKAFEEQQKMLFETLSEQKEIAQKAAAESVEVLNDLVSKAREYYESTVSDG